MQLRTEKWNELKENVRQNGFKLRNGSHLKYKILIAGVPISSFVLAVPHTREYEQPVWRICHPRKRRIGRYVIGVLSRNDEIVEYLVTDWLTKKKARYFNMTLPRMAKHSIVRFQKPSEFVDALKRAGYL